MSARIERADVRDGRGQIHYVRTTVEIPATSYNLVGLRHLIERLEAAEADMQDAARHSVWALSDRGR
jgi:hypothetical protein